ncbi:MAG: hypothetical protein GY800_10800 [Planctomycetes bacterium]|nr:hypothetical protein [Planctomycetota bacterium]
MIGVLGRLRGSMYSGADVGDGRALVMRATGCVSLGLQSKARSSSLR